MIFYSPETTYEIENPRILNKLTYHMLLDAYKELNTSWRLLKHDLWDEALNFSIEECENEQDITIDLFKFKGGKDNVSFHNALTLNTLYKCLSQLISKGVTREFMLECAIDIENKYEDFFKSIDSELNDTLEDLGITWNNKGSPTYRVSETSKKVKVA